MTVGLTDMPPDVKFPEHMHGKPYCYNCARKLEKEYGGEVFSCVHLTSLSCLHVSSFVLFYFRQVLFCQNVTRVSLMRDLLHCQYLIRMSLMRDLLQAYRTWKGNRHPCSRVSLRPLVSKLFQPTWQLAIVV